MYFSSKLIVKNMVNNHANYTSSDGQN